MNNLSFPRLGETSGGGSIEKIMVIERQEEGKNLHGVSPVLVEKTIQSYCGTVIAAKKTKDGKIFVTVRNESQAKNLAKISKLADGITVKVYEHKSLNSCKVVVFCRDVKNDTDAAILTIVKEQGITEVKQIMKGPEDNKTPTGIFILTVKGICPPKEIKLGYLLLETRPWYPNPLRCFKCLKFGHTSKDCNSEKKCSKCGEAFHDECNNEAKCVNCKNEHGAFAKECPVLAKEKQITKLKIDRNITFWEARNIVEEGLKTKYSNTVKASIDEEVKRLTEENSAQSAKIDELNEEKKTYAETLKNELELQFDAKLNQYKEELNNSIQEKVKKMEQMEENMLALQKRCEHLATSYKEEKHRRKQAEKEVEKLKENCIKLEQMLKLYGYKGAPKYTRSQENTIQSPPRKKKGITEMTPCDQIEYIHSDSEETDETVNPG